MKFCIIVGTRPEIIKLSPIIKECQKRKIDFFIIHSNQHYSAEMDRIFFEEMNLPAPRYNLQVGSGKHANQTGNILIKIEPILENEKPDVVMVQGDTNTVLAGALAAQKLGLKVAHLEAGLRSYDRTMPEETNRVVVDHLSDYLFAVTPVQKEILLKEGCDPKKIHVVGNSVVDSLLGFIDLAKKQSKILSKLKLESKKYLLLTAHRSATVDHHENLRELIDVLETAHDQTKLPIVWPIHPRTKASIKNFGMSIPSHVVLTEPLGYLDFLLLMAEAKIVLTDSGGLQEESCVLGVPCLTLRDNTERPETLEVGANLLVGLSTKKLAAGINHFLNEKMTWSNPFGDGQTAQKVMTVITGNSHFARKNQTVAMVGLGYMGLPLACILANEGYRVIGVDILESKVNALNQGQCPFEEQGMQTLLNRARENGFTATTKLPKSDIYIISVPTPSHNKKCELGYVLEAFKSVVDVAADGCCIIVESTIKPNTCKKILYPLIQKSGKNLLLAHCPERAIPGNTIYELTHNDRVVGGIDRESTEIPYKLYQSFCRGQVFKTDVTTAECIKLVENTFRDINIAFANELDEVLREFQVDPYEVIAIANRHPRVNVLSPGPGVGGHCIAVDPWFLVEDTVKGDMIRLARQINDHRPSIVVERAKEYVEKYGKKVGILGLAYKKNVDDPRESPAFEVIKLAHEKGWLVKANDPFVVERFDGVENIGLDELQQWADFLILVTDHDLYKKVQFKKPVYDTRNGLANRR